MNTTGDFWSYLTYGLFRRVRKIAKSDY